MVQIWSKKKINYIVDDVNNPFNKVRVFLNDIFINK